jgi:hypothetical protein
VFKIGWLFTSKEEKLFLKIESDLKSINTLITYLEDRGAFAATPVLNKSLENIEARKEEALKEVSLLTPDQKNKINALVKVMDNKIAKLRTITSKRAA